jgi:hypothetical protein
MSLAHAGSDKRCAEAADGEAAPEPPSRFLPVPIAMPAWKMPFYMAASLLLF